MIKRLAYIVLVLLPLSLVAQEQVADTLSAPQQTQQSTQQTQPTKTKKKASDIFTGFSGGMMLHLGYMFSDSPEKVFSNTGLGSPDYIKNLPRDGACFGLGGALRVHLINHIHLGAEGFVSTLPLMKTGSNIRTGWGGVLCDAYATWGKVRPMVGLTLGGGSMKRLFVPDQATDVSGDPGSETNYNASYVKTPFFFMDPYLGVEIALMSHMALLIRIDYMLPFGTTNSTLAENVNWGNFMTPSGPRLYIGLMFGRLQKKN